MIAFIIGPDGRAERCVYRGPECRVRVMRPPPPYHPIAVKRLIGHRMSDGDREAVLYLPEGERLTEKHARAVGDAMIDSAGAHVNNHQRERIAKPR